MNIPKVSLITKKSDLLHEDALIFLVFEDEKNLKKELAAVFAKTDVERMLSYAKRRKFEGKLKQIVHVPLNDDTIVVLVGLGNEKNLDLDQYRKAANSSLGILRQLHIESAGVVPSKTSKASLVETVAATAEGVLLGAYEFDQYKSKQKDAYVLECAHIIVDSVTKSLESSLERVIVISEGVYFARDLENETSDKVTPESFADEAIRVSKELKLRCKILTDVKKEKLGLLEAVGRGAEVPPRLVIVEYNGSGKKTVDVVLAGKGITFDSGGINLKPSKGGFLEQMHIDMGGAATVLATIAVLARLKVKKHVVGIMAMAENAIGPKSTKPGSIITSYSGKTVEIVDTDAEGRLVLGDALAYGVANYKPEKIIDVATLTGAIIISLGWEVAGIMGNDPVMTQGLISAGAKTHERLWELPLYDDLEEEVKSTNADIKNLGHRFGGRSAMSSVAAMFLKEFVGETKWAHLDIAGAAIMDTKRDYMPANGTGFGVRLLVEYFS